jgi:hypothetical protein
MRSSTVASRPCLPEVKSYQLAYVASTLGKKAEMERRCFALLAAALGAMLTLGVIAEAAGAQHRDDDAATPAPAATPEAAIRQIVLGTGLAYAGDCATTRSPEDTGKICSKFVAAQGGMRAYLIGRTFSEFSRWAFVRQTPAGWQSAGTVTLDLSASDAVIPWPS